jgi:Fe-S cluster assembly protein SufD
MKSMAAHAKTSDSQLEALYGRQFREARPGLPGAGLAWLEHRRDEAIGRFAEIGFPTPKVEAWKFTNLGPLQRIAFRSAIEPPRSGLSSADLAPFRLTSECHLAVFVNGRFRSDLSILDQLPEGSRIDDLSEVGEEELRALAAPPAVSGEAAARTLFDLNTAFMRHGAVIRLGRGAIIDPVQLLYVTTSGDGPSVSHPRNLIHAQAGSSATVLESYVTLGGAVYWTNVVTQVLVDANAVLRHYKYQAESDSAYHLATTSVRLGHEASYRMFALSGGAALARNELDVELAATEAEARLSGVTLARREQHLDTTIRVEHAKPSGSSAQAFRSVVDEHARAVFQGRIRVAPDAQKTDAQQISRSLLLSPTASADTKPELEILADDVKCSHGAAVGDLDKEALFYLRARGLGEADARRVLIDAFVGELVGAIESDALRPYFRRALDGWLHQGSRK